MHGLVEAWKTAPSDETEAPILQLLDSPEYRQLPYIERNRPFLTASKLKELKRCAYHAKLRYVDEIESPAEDAEHFVIGSAVDDWLTLGGDYFDDRYATVARRTEKAAEENGDKVLLTNTQTALIQSAVDEFRSREFFPPEPKKRNVIWLMAGMPCKAELDHFDAQARRIGDIKTCASITTFNPMDYALQMAFYAFGIEKRWQEAVEAELYVVDKHSGWSRSHKWVFSRATLRMQYFELEKLVETWKECEDSGIWPHCDVDTEEGRKIAWNSDYYTICPFCKSASPTLV